MGVAQFVFLAGMVIASVMASLIIPLTLLALLKAIPTTKHGHGVNYEVSGKSAFARGRGPMNLGTLFGISGFVIALVSLVYMRTQAKASRIQADAMLEQVRHRP